MADEISIDTSGFYPCLAKRDDVHTQAADILAASAERRRGFVTTDYVLDETATLLKTRAVSHLVQRLFNIVFTSHACRIEWMDPNRFATTRDFFVQRLDQRYSFTDCFSFTIMQELEVTDALTKDIHFSEAGFRPLLT